MGIDRHGPTVLYSMMWLTSVTNTFEYAPGERINFQHRSSDVSVTLQNGHRYIWSLLNTVTGKRVFLLSFLLRGLRMLAKNHSPYFQEGR